MSEERFIGYDYAKHPDKSVIVTGIAKYRREWAGTWYKPWTWFRFIKVLDGIKIDNVDEISFPLVSRIVFPLTSDDRLRAGDTLYYQFGQTDILGKMPPVVLNERSMWAVVDKDGDVLTFTIEFLRIECLTWFLDGRKAEGVNICKMVGGRTSLSAEGYNLWRHYKRQGYRCIKIDFIESNSRNTDG